MRTKEGLGSQLSSLCRFYRPLTLPLLTHLYVRQVCLVRHNLPSHER